MSLLLHQTTTAGPLNKPEPWLYMSLLLHQTTTTRLTRKTQMGCICLFSYIKPQLFLCLNLKSTSCICLFSYIKPQLSSFSHENSMSCICLFSYIKPQPKYSIFLIYSVLFTLLSLKKWHLTYVFFAKVLKKFQLQRFGSNFFLFFPPIIYDLAILLVGYAQDAYHSCRRDYRLNSLCMDCLTFVGSTMPDVNRIL